MKTIRNLSSRFNVAQKLIKRTSEKQMTTSTTMVSESKNVGSVSSLPAAISEEKQQINGDDIDSNSTILSAQSHDE